MKLVAAGRNRRREVSDDFQLSLFEFKPAEYGNFDTIRTDGREALAGVPAENGRAIGGDGPLARAITEGRGADRLGPRLVAPPSDATGAVGSGTSSV